jgi:hypothetical protein
MGVGDVEFGQTLEEGELREDEEVDIGDGNERDAPPSGEAWCSGCVLLSWRHRLANF